MWRTLLMCAPLSRECSRQAACSASRSRLTQATVRSSGRRCAMRTAKNSSAPPSPTPGCPCWNSSPRPRAWKTASPSPDCWCWRGDDNWARRVYLFGVLDRPAELPDLFTRWFATRGWTPRAHQLELLRLARAGRSALLIAPTGAGKTLAGFLPTLVELSSEKSAPKSTTGKKLISGRGIRRSGGLHTLYISPLKALAVDIARNL